LLAVPVAIEVTATREPLTTAVTGEPDSFKYEASAEASAEVVEL
jgi:hypothetical protein